MWYGKHHSSHFDDFKDIGVHVVSESMYWSIRISRGFCLDVYIVLNVNISEHFTVDLKMQVDFFLH